MRRAQMARKGPLRPHRRPTPPFRAARSGSAPAWTQLGLLLPLLLLLLLLLSRLPSPLLVR